MSWIAALGAAADAGLKAADVGAKLATAQKATSSTHQAKLGLKYGKLYDEWAARNMPTLNRAGMEAAGFNPILAINSGESAHGMANVGGHAAFGGIDTDMAGSASSAIDAYYGIERQKKALDQAAANIDNTNANTSLANMRKLKVLFDMIHPNGMWQSLSKNLGSAANFFFGPNSPEREEIFKGLRNVFKGMININNNNNNYNNNSSASGAYGQFSPFDPGLIKFNPEVSLPSGYSDK